MGRVEGVVPEGSASVSVSVSENFTNRANRTSLFRIKNYKKFTSIYVGVPT